MSKVAKWALNGTYYSLNLDEAKDQYQYWFVSHMNSDPAKIIAYMNI